MLMRLKLTPLLMFSLDLESRLIVVLSVSFWGRLRLKTQISRTDVDVCHVLLFLTLFLGLRWDPEGDKQNTLACFFPLWHSPELFWVLSRKQYPCVLRLLSNIDLAGKHKPLVQMTCPLRLWHHCPPLHQRTQTWWQEWHQKGLDHQRCPLARSSPP